MTTERSDVVNSHLVSAHAQLEAARTTALFNAVNGWRAEGLDEIEVELRAAEYAADLEAWLDHNLERIRTTVLEAVYGPGAAGSGIALH